MKRESPKQESQDSLQQSPAQKVNILLVDDDPNNLFILENTLTVLGENLVRAESGYAALERLHEIEFAVILLDVMMPEMDGLETATLIRKQKKSEKLPIIFLSAIERDDLRIKKGYEIGAVDFIFKPYDPVIVTSKVKVFVDLFRLREEVIQQKRTETVQLREALESHKLLTGWQDSSVSAAIYGAGPLQQRAVDSFAVYEKKYAALLDDYLEALAFSEKPPSHKVSQIAESLGRLYAGPRDVVQLHINCVTQKTKNVNPKRARAYTVEGRLLALELMGYLVDFYRLHEPLTVKEKENI
ncbi:MAG: response regulator [Betaproteobacteria bacterium]|nr:response regulator [Betaproteobacteria bacterium]